MKTVLCFIVGIGCAGLDETPPAPTPDISMGSVATPDVAMGSLITTDESFQPSYAFDAECSAQPPAHLRKHLVMAAMRYPDGATECELARQVQAESNFDEAAVSPAGAIGVSQFLPHTAAELGVDPLDARESIFGQARYLLWCRDGWDPLEPGRTHDDIKGLGLCCYNWGRGNCYADQRRHGWSLYSEAKPHLPDETQGYVFKIEGF